MYAAIRRYQGTAGTTEELIQAASQIAHGLSQARGFVSCIILEADPGVLTMVIAFEDRAGLEEADRMADRSPAEQWHRIARDAALVARGEVVFQRGM